MDEGSFIHAIWSCPLVLPILKQAINTFEGWLETYMPEAPPHGLLKDKSCIHAYQVRIHISSPGL